MNTIMKWIAITLVTALFLGSLAIFIPVAVGLFYLGRLVVTAP